MCSRRFQPWCKGENVELCNFYQLMPQKNCGICGYSSCNTFARHLVFGEENPQLCAWLENSDIQHVVHQVNPVTTRVEKNAVFQPCITDSAMVMAEIYLAPKAVDYSYLDPGFCEYLFLYFESVKCSKSLGIGRIEWEGKEILISHTGKVVVRHARNEDDAVGACQLLSRIVSGAVICSDFSTTLECVSGLHTCAEVEVQPSPEEMEIVVHLKEYENALIAGFSRIWKDEPIKPERKDITPLKMKAVNLLARNRGGLILYALAHHLQCIQEALKAVTHTAEHENQIQKRKKEKREQKKLFNLVKETLTSSYIPENYQHVLVYLNQYSKDPFFRELYKVVFHARCIGEIKDHYL